MFDINVYQKQIPPSEITHTYFLTSDSLRLTAATKFVVASTSRQPIIEYCLPTTLKVKGSNQLLSINLKNLKWGLKEWHDLIKHYPYSQSENPLVIRADWLITQLSDASISDGYYKLLYGPDSPSNVTAFLKFWGVQNVQKFGLIEGSSGIAKSKIRWLENRPVTRGYAWGTRDGKDVDFLEDPLGKTQIHDAEEWIVGIPKTSLLGQRGVLQVYFLAIGSGAKVNQADTDVVEDYTRFKNRAQVTIPGSCYQCHFTGINSPSRNELKFLIQEGVDVYADKKSQEELERFHFSNLEKEIKRNSEDFVDILDVINPGVTPENNLKYFRESILAYQEPLSLNKAIKETGEPNLKLALGYASGTDLKLPARLAALAHGVPIPRFAWEENYYIVQEAIRAWRKKE